MAGSEQNKIPQPLWLLAELTYACPLQCPYCSNPVEMASVKNELSTGDWLRVLREARKMGATQLGFSGGEPLTRIDLEELITEARQLGFYTNLITSGIGMDEKRIKAFKQAGLDHIQVSFQASSEELNNFIAGTNTFEHKKEMAHLVKKYGYPMVLCFVLHRKNEDQVKDILELSIALEADYVELATTQYYGWAYHNREQLLPTKSQLANAEKIAKEYQKKMEQIENIKSREVQSKIVEEKEKGIALPIPGTKAASELAAQMTEKNDGEQTETLSFADELKQGQTQNSENDITIIAIIAGIISAAIIGGVVLKLKKN